MLTTTHLQLYRDDSLCNSAAVEFRVREVARLKLHLIFSHASDFES